jgi:hypothetical protein
MRHRAGLAAPVDALSLLARAAPALGTLAPGLLRSATYSSGQWTFDLARLDPATVVALERHLARDGIAALHATNASGTRVRATLVPGAR